MKKPEPTPRRIEELRAMLAAYRQLTIDDVESSDWGDVQLQVEQELWRLEQELFDVRHRAWRAA